MLVGTKERAVPMAGTSVVGIGGKKELLGLV